MDKEVTWLTPLTTERLGHSSVFGQCPTDFQQLKIRPEYCPYDIKLMFAATPTFSSVRCFMHALLSCQYVTGIEISVTQGIT